MACCEREGLGSKSSSHSTELVLLNALRSENYTFMPSEGLISSLFPDTFVPSAFHARVRSSLHGDFDASSRSLTGCEWVFRHVDLDRTEHSNWHLSSFRMLVFLEQVAEKGSTDLIRRKTISQFLNAIGLVGIRPDQLLITVFGGGSIMGTEIPCDDSLRNAWIGLGVPSLQVVAVAGSSHFTNFSRAGEPAGPRCEVYFLPSGQFSPVEIATVVFEEWKIEKLHGQRYGLSPARNYVYGAAIGLERITACGSHLSSIWEMGELKPLVDDVCGLVANAHLACAQRGSVRQLVDCVRSLTVIGSACGLVGMGTRGRRLRKLGKTIRRCGASLGIQERQVKPLLVNMIDNVVRIEHLAKAPNISDVIGLLDSEDS